MNNLLKKVQKNLNKDLPDRFAVIQDITSGPISQTKKDALRIAFSKNVRNILNTHSRHGDKTALTNYIKQQGIEITHRNMQRFISEQKEHNLQISERTGFIILKHAVNFFDLSTEKIDEIATQILDAYLTHQADNYINPSY